MEFTLYYRGDLKAVTASNKRRKEKHELRKHFHKQLKELWNQNPLKEHRRFLDPNHSAQMAVSGQTMDETGTWINMEPESTILCEVGDFQFAPTVSNRLNMVAELTITLLRPESPGNIVTQSGDIDNRLKTLLDALKVPQERNELSEGVAPSKDEQPFFCLVSDDNLITNLDIKTDQWLEPNVGKSEVMLLIRVRTKLLRATLGTVGLA